MKPHTPQPIKDANAVSASFIAKLSQCPGKRLPKDFRAAIRMLERPYIGITEAEYAVVEKVAGDSDIVFFDGRPVTYGNADGGWALMPIKPGAMELDDVMPEAVGKKPKRQPVALDPNLPRFLDVNEMAARMSLNRFTVYRWLTQYPERLPKFVRLHGRVLFPDEAVKAFFAQHVRHQPTRVEPAKQEPKRRPGRPTKVEMARRRELAREY